MPRKDENKTLGAETKLVKTDHAEDCIVNLFFFPPVLFSFNIFPCYSLQKNGTFLSEYVLGNALLGELTIMK